MSLLSELESYSNMNRGSVGNVQADLKTSDGSDAGQTDTDVRGDVRFSMMRNIINKEDGTISGSEVQDYLERAHDLNDEVDTVAFGLEGEDDDIIKVYVNAEQADDFEAEMSKLLGLEDDIEAAVNTLAQKFDIVDVVWPQDPEGEAEADVDPDADLSIDDNLTSDDAEDNLDDEDDGGGADDDENAEDEMEPVLDDEGNPVLDDDGKPVMRKKKKAKADDQLGDDEMKESKGTLSALARLAEEAKDKGSKTFFKDKKDWQKAVNKIDVTDDDSDWAKNDGKLVAKWFEDRGEGWVLKESQKSFDAIVNHQNGPGTLSLDQIEKMTKKIHADLDKQNFESDSDYEAYLTKKFGGVHADVVDSYMGRDSHATADKMHYHQRNDKKLAAFLKAHIKEGYDGDETAYGSRFLDRLDEAAMEALDMKDTVLKSVRARLKRPYEKKAVELMSLCGVIGRYVSDQDALTDGVKSGAEALRRGGRVQKSFNAFYDAMKSLSGGGTASEPVSEEEERAQRHAERRLEEAKKGSMTMKRLVSVLATFGLPASDSDESGPLVTVIRKTSNKIDKSPEAEQALIMLAKSMGITSGEVNESADQPDFSAVMKELSGKGLDVSKKSSPHGFSVEGDLVEENPAAVRKLIKAALSSASITATVKFNEDDDVFMVYVGKSPMREGKEDLLADFKSWSGGKRPTEASVKEYLESKGMNTKANRDKLMAHSSNKSDTFESSDHGQGWYLLLNGHPVKGPYNKKKDAEGQMSLIGADYKKYAMKHGEIKNGKFTEITLESGPVGGGKKVGSYPAGPDKVHCEIYSTREGFVGVVPDDNYVGDPQPTRKEAEAELDGYLEHSKKNKPKPHPHGHKMTMTKEAIETADAYSEAAYAMMRALGLPEQNMRYQQSKVIASLRAKKNSLQSFTTIVNKVERLTSLINTSQRGGAAAAPVKESLLKSIVFEAFGELTAMVKHDLDNHGLDEPVGGPGMMASYKGAPNHDETELLLGVNPEDHEGKIIVAIHSPWDGQMHVKHFDNDKDGYKEAMQYANMLRTSNLKKGGRPHGWSK